jgi:nitrogen fixation/metabolism regulation signal transduction histidine kinase
LAETAPPPSARARPKPKRRRVGRIELRLTLAVVFMAAVPLVIGILLARRLAQKASDVFYDPRVGAELELSLETYGPMVRAIKGDMKHRADAIAEREPLRAAALLGQAKEVEEELRDAFDAYSDHPDPATGEAPLIELVALEVYADMPFETCLERTMQRPSARAKGSAEPPTEHAPPDLAAEFRRLARVARVAPPNLAKEHVLTQCKALSPEDAPGAAPAGAGGKSPMLIASFATDRARIERRKEAAAFVELYRELERNRQEWVRLNVLFFGFLLSATILAAAALGFLFARNVSRRVSRVADAAQRVAGGDLEVRVPESGDDEIGDLATSFNHMLGELERSRARIEYLQRVGAWQDMARRLAHEIKNPLTPILLAVEECHHKYQGDDKKMRRLLDTTLEIVSEEVGTLRRLVTEFSDFARLPRARLKEEPIRALLEEVRPGLERLGLGTDEADVLRLTPSGGFAIPVRVKVEVPEDGALRVAVDRQMLRKSIDNLVRNAVQAIRATGKGYRVLVHATALDETKVALDVDDDGPGVPEEDRARIFDPYVTTRTEGTGLGLAIVKKIVVEHGGTIACTVSDLGGARFRIVLPAAETAEARIALEEAEAVARAKGEGEAPAQADA